MLRWHPGREPETAQEVELRFRAEGATTVVELEHRGWAGLGDKARFAAACSCLLYTSPSPRDS